MLSGPRVRLRPFTEADFDERYRRHIDLSQRGDYYPLHLSSEATYRARFAENGWWSPNEGVLAILDDQGNLAGTVDFEVIGSDSQIALVDRFGENAGARQNNRGPGAI